MKRHPIPLLIALCLAPTWSSCGDDEPADETEEAAHEREALMPRQGQPGYDDVVRPAEEPDPGQTAAPAPPSSDRLED